MPPPIHVFLTTIASQPALRQRQEYILRILQAKRIPFNSYDLASDPDAKRLWRRKAPADKQQLPGILVGYQWVGTYSEFEEAVEYGELDTFLKLKEPWDPAIDEDPSRPPPEVKPVGVPGANLPMEMTPEHIKKHIIAEQSSPLRVKSKTKPVPVNKIDEKDQIDLGNELGYGLEGVKVTEDELMDLMGQLGLGGEEADDLAKGLVGSANSKKKAKSPLSESNTTEELTIAQDEKGKEKAKPPHPVLNLTHEPTKDEEEKRNEKAKAKATLPVLTITDEPTKDEKGREKAVAPEREVVKAPEPMEMEGFEQVLKESSPAIVEGIEQVLAKEIPELRTPVTPRGAEPWDDKQERVKVSRSSSTGSAVNNK